MQSVLANQPTNCSVKCASLTGARVACHVLVVFLRLFRRGPLEGVAAMVLATTAAAAEPLFVVSESHRQSVTMQRPVAAGTVLQVESPGLGEGEELWLQRCEEPCVKAALIRRWLQADFAGGRRPSVRFAESGVYYVWILRRQRGGNADVVPVDSWTSADTWARAKFVSGTRIDLQAESPTSQPSDKSQEDYRALVRALRFSKRVLEGLERRAAAELDAWPPSLRSCWLDFRQTTLAGWLEDLVTKAMMRYLTPQHAADSARFWRSSAGMKLLEELDGVPQASLTAEETRAMLELNRSGATDALERFVKDGLLGRDFLADAWRVAHGHAQACIAAPPPPARNL
jgi:hypothetical protein